MFFKKALLYITTLTVFTANLFTAVFAEPETVEGTTAQAAEEAAAPTLNISAEACILVDAQTGVILYEKNAEERLYPASITKIMTALLACENGDMSDTVTHSHNAVFNIGFGSSHIGMDEGEQVGFEDALYGILLESANEVCMAVAEHIDGTVEKFVERMNNKAAELGCKNTHFANPHGFHDPDHYTTCYDMSLIAKAAVQNEEFLKIFSTVDHTIPPTNKNVERYLHNKDKMMRPTSPYYYENVIGGKTGFHDEALNTLVTYAGKDDVKLISVVMKDNGAPLTYSDTVTLMEYGFSLYQTETLFTGDSYSADIPVIQSYKDKVYDLGTVSLKGGEDFTVKVPSFITPEDITVKAHPEASLRAPVEVGAEAGTLDLYYDGYLLGSMPIVTATGVDAVPQSELEHRENMERLKAFSLKALKIAAIAAVSLFVIILLLKLISKISALMRKRRRKIYSYGGRYNSKSRPKLKTKAKPKNNRRKKVKYKLKIK